MEAHQYRGRAREHGSQLLRSFPEQGERGDSLPLFTGHYKKGSHFTALSVEFTLLFQYHLVNEQLQGFVG